MNHRSADTAPPGLRMHHQLRHGEPVVLPRRKIQVANDPRVSVVAAAWIGTGGQQMLGAMMCQLPQNLLANGCHVVELCCCADEFTYLLLLPRGQRRPPLG